MSSIKINGKEYSDIQLVKLNKGKQDEAIAKLNTSSQGADDVVFKIGDDVFVASGRDLFNGLKTAGKPFMGGEGITVELNGKKAEVLAWDNQANNGAECAKWSLLHGALVPMSVFNMAKKFGLPKVWTLAATAAPYAATIGAAFMYGKFRKVDASALTELGTVVQKNTQPAGGVSNAVKSMFGK